MIQHLAIILDGNRRWAHSKMLPAIAGHKAGADNLQTVTRLCNTKGIKYLTVWGLSTENLKKRGALEIAGIVKILNSSPKLLQELIEEGVKIKIIGDISQLPEKTQTILNTLVTDTQDNTGIVLTLALIYGGQDEIIRATKKIITSGLDPEKVTPEEFRKYLDTSFLPYPDVIVRTGGDVRHSGFLLFDSAYSEYYFTEKKWPEFDEKELDHVIDTFISSKRNFGK